MYVTRSRTTVQLQVPDFDIPMTAATVAGPAARAALPPCETEGEQSSALETREAPVTAQPTR